MQATDFDGKAVITWASRKAYQGVIEILPERSNLNPDIANTLQGRILRSWATGSGREGAVRMELELTNPIPRHEENRQSTEILSTEPPELPFQKAPQVLISKGKLKTSSSAHRTCTLSGGTDLAKQSA